MRQRPLHALCPAPPGRRKRGTILIVVMWVALGLVSLALFFADGMILEYRTADNSLASLQAAQAIEGARRYVAFQLKNLTDPGQIPDPEEYPVERLAVGDAAFWVIGRPGDNEAAGNTPVFRLRDENSKLNLNTATLEMLEMLPGMTPEFAAAIVDWRDEDPDITPGGAEAQEYLLLDTPYNCKDSRFETVEELRLVMGCDRTLLYGEDFNHNGVLDLNEDDGAASFPDDNRDGILDPGLFEYVTVFSRESNTQADGSARVNIRTDSQGLTQVLRDALGSSRANEIRQAFGNSASNIRSALELAVRGQMTPDEFALIEDRITVASGNFIEGRVNVNTAPVAVLNCLPGMDEEKSRQIVANRSGRTAEELRSIAWVSEVLEPETAILIGPHVTTRSYQFSADVAAVGHNGRGFRRDLMIFDTTGEEPVIIYRRDLTRLGWPLGQEVRRQLASAEE